MVNVLDEVHNPGVREAVKRFSQWPTLPQVMSTLTSCNEDLDEQQSFMLCSLVQIFVNGEFIGGSDIIEELHASGELQDILVQP